MYTTYVGGGESKSKHSAQPHGRYVHIRMDINRLSIRESVDSLCRIGADVQYNYARLKQKRTSPQLC